MWMTKILACFKDDRMKSELGQSIIIIALGMVVLLAFVGMAIDVGLLYGLRVQLFRSVDAAALAGVIELPDLELAEARARQFIRLNGFDPDEMTVSVESGIRPSNFLTVTVSLPMETMFLRFIGLPTVEVPAMAVAEFRSPIEVYASQHSESGVTGAVNLNVFGKDSNPQWGDAFMATDWTGPDSCTGVTPSPNPYWRDLGGKYPFRIHVPANYEVLGGTSEIQVEILDPDCYNNPFEGDLDIKWIDGSEHEVPVSGGQGQVKAVETGDLCGCNDFWQVRMDQYLPFCSGTAYEMTTRYTLYYYKPNNLTKHRIARYGKGCDSDTDLKWVVPNGFLFDINDYPEVMTDEDGNKSFFIDIEGLAGTYGNGFDLWAGPPPTDPDLPDDVNERNVYLLDKILNEGANPHDSGGVVIWAIGYLPLNVNATTAFTITLGYIPPEAAGVSIRISSWDMDKKEKGAPCYCEATGHNCLGLDLDYYLEDMPDFHVGGDVSCSTKWGNDIFQIPPEFYGGYLYAVYHTTAQDTTDWKIEYLSPTGNTYVRLVK